MRSVCATQQTLGWASLAWAVAVPLLLGSGGVTPLPPAAALTSLLVGLRGASAAEERTAKGLERFAGNARSAILLGALNWAAPRYTAVPGGPSAAVAAGLASRVLGLSAARAAWWANGVDSTLSLLVALYFIASWRAARSLRLAIEYQPSRVG
jgi:hypothetical protein